MKYILVAAILLYSIPAFAYGDVEKYFDGSVTCYIYKPSGAISCVRTKGS